MNDNTSDNIPNYKDTIFLPQTDFPMRANLPKTEQKWLNKWQAIDLYRQQRHLYAHREKFILHDGPPYANGNIHIGHALNKILKDIISRSQGMLGRDANYVPGWDCHGLPIEWKVEEKYHKKKQDKDSVPIIEFRQECRAFADKWIDIQRDEFKRLGVIGDWDNPYKTMNFDSEAQILTELFKLLLNGSLYRGLKPVMWSPIEKTALAEAEIEYANYTSTTIYVAFPILGGQNQFKDARVVIWTTTPWTIPGNRAICYRPEIDYTLIEVKNHTPASLAQKGDRLIISHDLLKQCVETIEITEYDTVWHGKGVELENLTCAHPLRGKGYDFDVPLLPGDHVTTEQGTGLVHTAPSHGVEDFQVAHLQYGIEVPESVLENGTYAPSVPLFAGKHVYKAASDVCQSLIETKTLLHQGTLLHSYPHSWRSKKPLIYRATSQWFISLTQNSLREKALKAIAETKFFPKSARKRLHDMVSNRPDWCVSRQRAWGVPLSIFVHKSTGEPLRDANVNQRIIDAVKQEGADAWFNRPAADFLGPDYNEDDFEQISDILDVWFDSGVTHQFVLNHREDLQWPANLCLEGSDQHRGWFQSSLIESCATTGRAPYDAILTHGFTLDGEGRKMSKSQGNITAPKQIINEFGADILRLWVASTDYHEDQRISSSIIKTQTDVYRRIRNTLRFIIGALNGFTDGEHISVQEMPELDRWALHQLKSLDRRIRNNYTTYNLHDIYLDIHNFCNVDMSNFYLDIRKDALYCDTTSSIRRRACRTVLNTIFECLTLWIAPILCFTAEEAWAARYGNVETDSVHLKDFLQMPDQWLDDALDQKWKKIRKIRRVVTGALEGARKDKAIGSSLQAHVTVYTQQDIIDIFHDLDLAEICITSSSYLTTDTAPEGAYTTDDIQNVAAHIAISEGEKCARCWQVYADVGTYENAPGTCKRCAQALL